MTNRPTARGDPLDALSPRVQRWIQRKKWPALRPIQKKVIPQLLDELRASREHDFVISAPTASGKTEAVFLPIATILDEAEEPQEGAEVLYICPLVALIDQQAGRLSDGLIDSKRYAVTPWHARAATAGKRHFEARPGGVLVITPESLESMFINRSSQLPSFFGRLRCIVIDEFHAFFNSPRGMQLVSQLNRIDRIANRKVSRLALSATFNPATQTLVKEQLRPASPASVILLNDEHGQHKLEFQLHAYPEVGDPADAKIDRQRQDIADQAFLDFRNLHASGTGGEKAKGLIFVNSRKEAEFFSYRLNEMANDARHDVSFFPHHGSLGPDERKEAETAIRDRRVPAVIVCTSTLELGIDIGMITQVGQIDPGSSVSSLHQRLGRSGRRHGQVGKLIMYVRDADVGRTRSSPLAELHLPTFQALAQISLVQEKAYEPPDRRAAHLSTLIQQILSFAAQQGGKVSIDIVRDVLVETGPFQALRRNADPDDHLALLFARLEQYELLERESEAEYGLTHRARKLMDDYRFFAAFQGGDDYRVQSSDGTHLGTVPSANLYSVGDRIIYARRTWTIVRISREMKVIAVAPAPDGHAPIFSGDPIPPSQAVVSRMEELYKGTARPHAVRLGDGAKRLYDEGLAASRRLQLCARSIIEYGKGVLLLPWVEYRGQLSLVRTLRYWGANASSTAVAVFVEGMDLESVKALVGEIAEGKKAPPEASEAMRAATSLIVDKHDHLLSPYLQRWNAATFRLDMDQVPATARRLLHITATQTSGTPRPRHRRH